MITRYNILYVLFLTVCLCFSAVASPIDECYKESDNRIEVSKCLDNKLSKSESSLDKKVAEARNNMQKLSKQINTIYPIRSFNLSQQAFLIYRKSNCDWLFDKSYIYGGSGDILKDCLIRMNLERIIELDRDYKFDSVEDNKTPNPDNKKNKESVTKSQSGSIKESNRDNSIDNSTRYDNSEYQEYEQPLNVDLPDDCYLIPDQGECKGSFVRYYYYQDIGKCRAFLWGGCNGVVPFESMTECREVCVQNN